MIARLAEVLQDRRARFASGVACSLLLLGVVGWIVALAYRQPIFNFDLVDYVALAIEWSEPDPVRVHQRTYEVLAAELPPEVYEDFTTGGNPTPAGPFRQRVRDDWKPFDANLGYHRGRYLYTLAVAGVHALGVPLVSATRFPNLVFWSLTAILILVWARRHYAQAPAALLTLGVLVSPPVLSQLPASSPDSLAMFLLTLALYLLIEHRAFRAAIGLMTLTILVRSDFVLVSGGIAAALFLLVERARRPSNAWLAGWLLACTTTYLLVASTARDPGWWAAFVGMRRRVGDFSELPPFRIDHFFIGVRQQLESMSYLGYDIAGDGSYVRGSNFVFAYCAAAAVGIAVALRARLAELDVRAAVLAGLVVATLARVVVLPYLWDRYYVYLWVPVPMCLAGMLALLADRASTASAQARPDG